MFGSKIILGILIGVFVIPAVVYDPVGTYNTASNVISTLGELAGAIGGAIN